MSEEPHNISSVELNRLFLLLIAVIIGMLLLSIYAWSALPDAVQIPVHWGPDGQPDRYGSKTEGLLMLPGIAFLLAVLFRIIPIIEPRRRNLLRSFVAYRALNISMVTFMAALHVAIIGNLLEWYTISVMSIVGLLLSALFLVLGNYLGKVRSNFMFGIRTPWTLSSNLAWDKTHRLGGRILVVIGAIGILAILFSPDGGMRIFITMLLGWVAFLFVYSYLVWRTAPDKNDDGRGVSNGM